MNVDIKNSLEVMDLRLRTMLPEEYQDSYEELQPVSMGSAGLKFDAEGRVAWDEIWGSFCDLAMAGGPPHKGTLLGPVCQPEGATSCQPEKEAAADRQSAVSDRQSQVAQEICRGVMMAAGLDARPSPHPGWIRVECYGETMAGWLLRAITMENVAVRREGAELELPAGSHFRLEKEIKNVVTVVAKTSHYWLEHMSRSQQRAIASLFAELAETAPLIEPGFENERTVSEKTVSGTTVSEMTASETTASDTTAREATQTGNQRTASVHHGAASVRMADAIQRHTGLVRTGQAYAGWLGIACPSVRAAVWMMRAMVVSNVLARREESVLFLPMNVNRDGDGDAVARRLAHVHALALAKGVL